MNSNKMTYIAAGLIIGALAFKFAPKLKMMAEDKEIKDGLLNKVISFLTTKEEIIEEPKVERMVYDYGSIEIPEPVLGMGGKSIGQTSLETSVSPIVGIGQNSSDRIIGGY